MKKTVICTLVACLSASVVGAQEDFGPVNTGTANFLTIAADARSAAMGGSGVALAGNDNAIFINASSVLAEEERKGGASYTFAPWMRDYQTGYSLHTLGGFYKLNERNAILAGVRYYNYPKMNAISTGETIRPKELSAEVGYAHQLFRGFSMSATFRYVYSDMGKVGDADGASTVAFDWGMFYRKGFSRMQGASWTAALQVSNLGPKMKYLTSKESLPAMAKLGGAVDLPFSPQHKLVVTADLGYRLMPSDVNALNVSAGAEYTLAEHFMFRGGYHYGDKEKGDPCYGTLGAGMNRYGGHIDFAWLFAADDCLFRNSFWVTLGYSF